MITNLLLSLLLFCPLNDSLITNGYHCWSYQVSLDAGLQACPPGLCIGGVASGTLPHEWTSAECSVSEAGGWIDVPDPDPGHFVMFSAEPNDVPDTFFCTPGFCASVWWNVTTDLSATCVCPGGEC